MMNTSSHSVMSHNWFLVMKSERMNLLLIPSVLLTTITLVINSLLLFCIFYSPFLRQETCYLLLANTLLSDILFLIFNLTKISCNALDREMQDIFCEVLVVASVTTYSCSVLTVTLMVMDTFVAVRWPLRYNAILSLSRVKKIIGLVWVVAVMYPLFLLVVMEVRRQGNRESLKACLALLTLKYKVNLNGRSLHVYFSVGVVFCTLLILYCYVRLYMITRSSGIWQSRYSRARLTLLAHAVMLLVRFTPCFVFMVELGQFEKLSNNLHLLVWINTLNNTVVMVGSCACAPFLYGLRNREFYETVKLILWKRWVKQNSDSTPTPAALEEIDHTRSPNMAKCERNLTGC